MLDLIRVVSLQRTCQACPSQWEGRTDDGRWVYVRYRWGHLQVGIGPTLEDAVDNDSISLDLGDELDGVLSYDELRAATVECVEWPHA